MTEEQGYVVETARQMATHVGVLIGSVEQLAHEREQLLRSRRRAQGPEARADPSREHHGPPAHVP